MITMVSTCCLNQFREMSIFWGKVINLTFLDFYFLYKGSFQKLPTYFSTLYFLPHYMLLAQPTCVCHLVAFAQSEEDFCLDQHLYLEYKHVLFSSFYVH